VARALRFASRNSAHPTAESHPRASLWTVRRHVSTTSAVAVPEVVGGIPVITASGTPRSIGETIGQRLRSRLQVLAQYLREQLMAAISAVDAQARPTLSNDLKQLTLTLATSDPTVWMELESMARAAEVSEEDLLIVYGYSDLLSRHRCAVPPVRSSYLGLTAAQTDTGNPRLVYTCLLYTSPSPRDH
jgi:hypothetical protein